MTLKEKLFAIEAGLIGNRINILSMGFLFGGLFGFEHELLDNHILNSLAYVPMLIAGFALTGQTLFGVGTAKAYKRTLECFKEIHKLDEDFFRAYVRADAGKKLEGYCELQGIYLACRDYAPEQISEFKKLKKHYTQNILPNF